MIGEQVLFRIMMRSTDHVHGGLAGVWGVPAYEWITQRARRRHMAGATVLRGVYGFGHRGLSPLPGWHVAHHMPVIVEIVDSADAIARFCREEIWPHISHGTITLERAAVMRYRHRESHEANQPLELFERVKDLSTLPDIGGSDRMKTQEDGVLLRIFTGDSDTFEGRPLYEGLVRKVRELGLAGATVLKGSMGFGAHSVLHTAKVTELSTDLPVVIEVVDTEEKIRQLLPAVDGMVREGMITMEAVRILAYRQGGEG
jgi:PII-like signaling protein